MKYKTAEQHFLAQIVIRIVQLHLERRRNYSWLKLIRTEESRKAMELRNESITRTITVLSDSFKNNCNTPLHKASF